MEVRAEEDLVPELQLLTNEFISCIWWHSGRLWVPWGLLQSDGLVCLLPVVVMLLASSWLYQWAVRVSMWWFCILASMLVLPTVGLFFNSCWRSLIWDGQVSSFRVRVWCNASLLIKHGSCRALRQQFVVLELSEQLYGSIRSLMREMAFSFALKSLQLSVDWQQSSEPSLDHLFSCWEHSSICLELLHEFTKTENKELSNVQW